MTAMDPVTFCARHRAKGPARNQPGLRRGRWGPEWGRSL